MNDLPLLTLGSQFQGGNNNAIGRLITDNVFQAITDIVSDYIIDQTDATLTVKNPKDQVFVITEASDPDITVEEQVETSQNKRVAIEIKGGTDVSNAHNRAGEAEKSHLKAKNDGFKEFWTLAHITGLDLTKLRSESPTTNVWHDVAQVVAQSGIDWDAFQERVRSILDLPIPEPDNDAAPSPLQDTLDAARAPLTADEAQSIAAQE